MLPGILVVGFGIGLTMATVMGSATLGVRATDAGVASAMVNTGQQIGGSVGTALLSTLASSAATSYLADRPRTASVAAEAAVHGYATAFWISAAIFAAGGSSAPRSCGRACPRSTPPRGPLWRTSCAQSTS